MYIDFQVVDYVVAAVLGRAPGIIVLATVSHGVACWHGSCNVVLSRVSIWVGS